MVLLVGVLLVLLFTLNNKPSSTPAAQVTPTVPLGSAPGSANGSTGAPPVVAVTATQSLTGTGTYMTIDTAKGKIVAKLYTDPAAGVTKTVNNFVSKANAGYFNGLTFHRVEDWVIQGGDPTGTGSGGGKMPAEYNNIPFGVGAVGVARAADPTINNDSQFFIVKDAAAAAGLVGQYTNFGQVIQGMDVVKKIAIGDKINSMTIQNK
jgi:cyclophilin family peptidyl-prolyl cis-trans isomerase